MKGTEVLTLGAVGVINLYTHAKVRVHTTKLLHVIIGFAHPVHILMSEWCRGGAA